MGRSILHLADLHLGSSHAYAGSRAQQRARESDAVLDRVAEWIAMAGPGSRDIAAVLIAGDLFDSPTPPEPLVAQTIRALRKIEGAGIRVVTVPGNHDEWTYPDGVFRKNGADRWPGVLVIETAPRHVATIDLEGGARLEIASCAFHQGRNPKPADWTNPWGGEKPPGTRRIGLFHGTADQVGDFLSSGERAFRLDLDRLAAWGLDYIALGHIHKRQEIPCAGCVAIYPGPIEGQGFDDPGSQDLTIVDFGSETARVTTFDARAAGIRTRDISVATCDPLGISDAIHLGKEIERLADPNRILRFVLGAAPRFEVDLDELRERLAPSFYHLDIDGAGSETPIIDWERLSSERSLAGIFVRKVTEARDADPDAVFWDEVAAAGLRALGMRKAR
jgi:DNA repair protein SbcD/Mre11